MQGAFLTGVMEASRATGDGAYVDYARKTAEANGWQLGPRADHADDYIVGQTYLELNALAAAPGQLDDTKKRLDALVAKPITGRELWWWCDALYMCPPALAKLAHATGDAKYLEALDRWCAGRVRLHVRSGKRPCYRDRRYLFPKEGEKGFLEAMRNALGGAGGAPDRCAAGGFIRCARYIALYGR